jgi:hypothetical protein
VSEDDEIASAAEEPAPSGIWRVVAATAGIVVWLVGAAVVANALGLAGWRGGFVVAFAVVASGAAVIAWFGGVAATTGERAAWLVGVAVVAVLLSARSVDAAPPSQARLQARLDHLKLPFFRVLTTTSGGHGWCRPTCPQVERTYEGPALLPPATVAEAIGALNVEHLVPDVRAAFIAARQRPATTIASRKLVALVSATSDGQHARLTIRLVARRR